MTSGKILRIQLGAWFAVNTRIAPVYGGFEEVHTNSTLSGGARVGVRIRRRGQICASSSLLVLVCSLPHVTGDDFIDLSSLVSGSHLSDGCLARGVQENWSVGEMAPGLQLGSTVDTLTRQSMKSLAGCDD